MQHDRPLVSRNSDSSTAIPVKRKKSKRVKKVKLEDTPEYKRGLEDGRYGVIARLACWHGGHNASEGNWGRLGMQVDVYDDEAVARYFYESISEDARKKAEEQLRVLKAMMFELRVGPPPCEPGPNTDVTAHLYYDKGRGTWAYAVSIGTGTHKIGYGDELVDALRMIKKGVESASRYLDKTKS